MAMLASKSPFPALGQSSSNLSSSSVQTATISSSRRAPAMVAPTQSFSSPTESEFSDLDGPDTARNWDEERVCDWLVTVNCGEYEKLFRKNNINGENLLEMDKAVLQEMGIDKIGDRVRLFLQIKKLRTRAYANQKKRNRVSWHICVVFRHCADIHRTPLLDSMHTPHHLGLLDPLTQLPERYRLLLPTRDTRGNLMDSHPRQPFPKMSASRLRGRVRH